MVEVFAVGVAQGDKEFAYPGGDGHADAIMAGSGQDRIQVFDLILQVATGHEVAADHAFALYFQDAALAKTAEQHLPSRRRITPTGFDQGEGFSDGAEARFAAYAAAWLLGEAEWVTALLVVSAAAAIVFAGGMR